ncbi:hypothetical protein [Caldilinea sp.]|uniref:hypothetical protein n=1 Tax=Caldilinea sp. TaxID=2293560 RepID=UPI002C1D363B|nr:hypothetical protein [Caldilinea sp.]HRA66618.1 hypothetical protein [Caldilinea sp.]
MNEPLAPQQIPLPSFIRRSNQQYRWSLWITLAILLVQVLVFLGSSIYLFAVIDWEMASILDDPPAAVLVEFTQAAVLLPFALLILLCLVVCLARPRPGWHMAMIAESLILLVALQVYLSDRNQRLAERPLLFVYMLGAILVIVFMNSPEGRLLLGRKPDDIHPGQHG